MLGVLGGMGPLATADFMVKLAQRTPARSDAEHVPVLVRSVPDIPSRVAAIAGTGPSPLPMLRRGLTVLLDAGAKAIVVPCHTAHVWADAMQSWIAPRPLIRADDAIVRAISRAVIAPGPVGLLATQSLLSTGLYQEQLRLAGYRTIPLDQHSIDAVMTAIALVKAGDVQSARSLVEQAVAAQQKAGAAKVILACTELPVAVGADWNGLCVDTTECLADACIAWWQSLPPDHKDKATET